jgi:hypothetical protein
MATVITDTTANPLVVANGQTLNAFNAVQVADSIGTTETVTVTLGFDYFSYFSPNADFGSITDPNGGGTYDSTTHTFTESGLVTGDPTFATSLLKRLVYKPPTLQNGQSAALTAKVTVADTGNTPQTDPTTIVIDAISPPAINGTVANAPVSATPGNTIRPFATTTIMDTNFAYSAKDTATIKITDGGALTDADGLLTGPGLSKTPGTVGTYTLSNADYAYTIGYELQNLVFTPAAVTAGQTRTTAFELDVNDAKAGLTTTDTKTSVLQFGPAVTPIIAGTLAGQTVVAGSAIKPFTSVSISDGNTTPSDTVTIRLLNSNGTATDANGTLSGTGLTETAAGSGVYTLAAGSPATINSELNALTFTPAALPNGQTSVTTRFELSVADAGQTTTDNATTVTETAPTPPPSGNFLVSDQTTGGPTMALGGEPYSGPVAGITQDIILATSDNINVAAQIPNVFIHTGSGNDAIDVSSVNGNNILDGGTGSNFLTGGTGNDNFYLDNRSPNAPIFSTVVNFHSGDNATVWGVNATDFSLLELDNQGAAGHTGLDFIFSAPGHTATSFVLAGFSSGDLSNGRLSLSYGKTADLPNLPGSEYLTVHAN